MRFPNRDKEAALHHRVLAFDPVASADVLAAFTELLVAAVQKDLRCDDDTAWDSAIDATFEYIGAPSAYDASRGRLSTFLVRIAKRRAIDRIRARNAEARREQDFAASVELRASAPKEEIERTVEARQIWQKIEQTVQDERDRAALRLILDGERSTEVLAKAIGISGLSKLERQLEVKRHRDRLLKVVERLGARLRGDERT